YPVHRHRFADIRSRTSCSVGVGFSVSNSWAIIKNPGVQNPHCNAWFSENAFCKACRSSPSARLSTVCTSQPSPWAASIKHDRAVLPFTSTVQEPHTPCSPPTCTPRVASWCRSTSDRSSRTWHTTVVLRPWRSEEHTSELQSRGNLVCRHLLEKKNERPQ